MEIAGEMSWALSAVGSPSQVLEQLEVASLDTCQSTSTSEPATAAKSKSPPASDGNAGHKSLRSAAHDSLSPLALRHKSMSFSSKSFYGLRDVVCNSLGQGHLEVTRIVDAAAKDKVDMHKVTSPVLPRGVKHDEYYWWTIENDAALNTYIAAFQKHLPNTISFISKADVLARVKEARLPHANPLIFSFANAVLALGAYYYQGNQQRLREDVASSSDTQRDNPSPTSSENSDLDADPVSWRLRATLGSRRGVQSLPSNMLKLQMSLLMASVAHECEIPSLVTENIATAVMHIRELGLLYETSVDVSGPLLAYAYVLDVSHAVDRGVPPLLDCNWMGDSGPSSHAYDGNLQGIRYLAAVMHKTMRKQFSTWANSAMKAMAGNKMKRHSKVNDQLRQWTRLFPDLNLRTKSEKVHCLPTSLTRLAYCMYHRAVFLAHCPWIAAAADRGGSSSSGNDDNEFAFAHDCCIRVCLGSARQVIDAIPFFFSPSSAGTMFERGVSEEHRRKAIALTGLCQGSLARISLDEGEIGDSNTGHQVLECARVMLSVGNASGLT
ncbi:hypothetical protein LZ30DRAFT_812145 [Colletotrichum cereale]|nr:hypothetical protein LZ30DRAFT_812145 [Colletotrichum cereale]